MNRLSIAILILTGCLSIYSQVPLNVSVQILKAEDSRRYTPAIQNLMFHKAPAIRSRAALAAGRIGDEAAIGVLVKLLEADPSLEVRAMAAFAIGEIESAKGVDAILGSLKDQKTPDAVRARAVEAAGKIAAANPKDPTFNALGKAILETLDGRIRERETVMLAITAALRARPEGTDKAVAKFLTSPDAGIRADAANTLSRIRAKNANEAFRTMLRTDRDPIARANAARALGAAEDKEAFELLLTAATDDNDSRVRVSAIRSLSQLNDPRAAEKLIIRGRAVLDLYKKEKKPNFIPNGQSEFIEIAAVLGRLLTNTYDQRAVSLFREFGQLDKGHATEVYLARFRIAPGRGDDGPTELTHWRQYRTLGQLAGEFATLEPTTEEAKKMKAEAPDKIRPLAKAFASADPAVEGKRIMAGPDILQAFARFKTADLGEIARIALLNKDVQMRATAAGILAGLPSSIENVDALNSAFRNAILNDLKENDAQLAILDALFKLDKRATLSALNTALISPDYIVRIKALDQLKDRDAWTDVPPAELAKTQEIARIGKAVVWPYDVKSETKLGQVLNIDADYRRALARKNGKVKAVLTTQKGTFTIDLLPEDAPLTVDNFVKLARSRYFDGLEVHRVVPNFVMQDGDPLGNGSGGPGWSIRCEVNMVPYDRGAVGMALSGKDTGGSQWFVTHSPQPHLDGGYTVFGKVNETGMKGVDSMVRGDKIIRVSIVGK
ncbi:hypothetical protein BH20ACI2_BH20ACI2_07250 [soil metagenome]